MPRYVQAGPSADVSQDGSTPAKRPVIDSLSADEVQPGGNITVSMEAEGNYTFSMVRFGAATHSVNTDQRRCPLNGEGSGRSFTLTVPADAGVALPGYWMMFAINEAGVPSLAKTFRVYGIYDL